MFGASILKTVYGQDVRDMNDQYFTDSQIAVEGINVARMPGAFWVEYFKIFRFIPGWIPGVAFKKVANYYRHYVEKMRDHPFEVVKAALI